MVPWTARGLNCFFHVMSTSSSLQDCIHASRDMQGFRLRQVLRAQIELQESHWIDRLWSVKHRQYLEAYTFGYCAIMLMASMSPISATQCCKRACSQLRHYETDAMHILVS